MAKVKTAFFCKHCGAQYSKWQGQCHACKEWNTLVEEVLQKPKTEVWQAATETPVSVPIPIEEVSENQQARLATGDAELDRVLGGGVVPGSLVLLAGEPGVGKSTLLLQLALQVNYPTLYVSGEESLTQIKLRSNRMNNGNSECFLLNETNVEQILTQANTLKPKLLIVDSIQTLQTDLIDSGAGSVSQVRECTSALQRFAKQMHIPVLVVGHITKDGMIAGPKILEHMVDVVLHFEGLQIIVGLLCPPLKIFVLVLQLVLRLYQHLFPLALHHTSIHRGLLIHLLCHSMALILVLTVFYLLQSKYFYSILFLELYSVIPCIDHWHTFDIETCIQ